MEREYKFLPSRIGFGAATLGNEYGMLDSENDVKLITHALERGINYFDTAPYYGRGKSEKRLGEALSMSMKNLGKNRGDIFISTKVGRYDVDRFDFSKETVKTSVLNSLSMVKTDYIDLCICHDVEFVDPNLVLNEALPILIHLKNQGLIKNIGISGYPLETLLRIVTEANERSHVVDFILSYCHYTLQNDLLKEYAPKFAKFGVKIINGSPLGMGLLTRNGPPGWHPASKEILEKCRVVSQYCDEQGVDIAEVALNWALQNDFVESTLVGLSSIDEVEMAMRAISTETQSEILHHIEVIMNEVKNQVWTK